MAGRSNTDLAPIHCFSPSPFFPRFSQLDHEVRRLLTVRLILVGSAKECAVSQKRFSASTSMRISRFRGASRSTGASLAKSCIFWDGQELLRYL
jgi:hypothetical protein